MDKYELKSSDYINELVLYFDADVDQTTSLFTQYVNNGLWIVFFSVLAFFVYLFYAIFLLLNPRHSNYKIETGRQICVSRSFATSSKLNFLKNDNVIFFIDKPNDNCSVNNIYALPLYRRAQVFIKSFLFFIRDITTLSRDISRYVAPTNLFRVLKFYIIRLPHKVGFESYLEHLLKTSKPRVLVTGNKEDRYALAEQSVSKRLCITLVCYPHGLEYAMKLPRGVVGDIFYCLSVATQAHYDNIYQGTGQDFRFSEEIAKKMLGRDLVHQVGKRKVVFFPESRGVEINQRIVKALIELKVDFYLKLHPLDSIKNYSMLGISEVQVLNDFNAAVSGNVVLARKSTVLLEALYSGSTACAVLIDDDDRFFFENEFPSLWDSRVRRTYSFNELVSWIESQVH